MWVLKRLNDGLLKYLTSDKDCYTVGRKNCDFVLEDDTSISRKHSTIHIGKKSNCPFPTTTATGVWIVDEGSKYGTFLGSGGDWLKLNSNKNTELKNGSIIKFGLMENIWRLEYKPVIICASGIQSEQKKEMEKSIKLVDGEFKNSWTKDCCLVVVNEITLTVKIVLALINGTPIVKPIYLVKLIECIRNQEPFPDPKKFRPEIKESILDASKVSLDPENTRKKLFENKKFLIPTKRQMETLKEVIVSAGGRADMLALSGNWDELANKNVTVIQLPVNTTGIPDDLSNTFKKIVLYLKEKHKKRVVPESEIAQAVAYSSIEKYCNPDDVNWLFVREFSKEMDLGDVIVQETPQGQTEADIPDGCIPDSQVSMPPSQSSPPTSSTPRKRVHSPEALERGTKRLAKDENYSKTKNYSKIENRGRDEKHSEESCSKEENFSTNNEPESKETPENNEIENLLSEDNYEVKLPDENDDFWTLDPLKDQARKRRLLQESSHESPQKKFKQSENNTANSKKTEERELRETMKILSVSEQKKKSEVHKASQHQTKIQAKQDDDNFNGFISPDKVNLVKTEATDLNITLFSADLLSLNYLKDGSLIQPPSIPTNVKKFKKQKVLDFSVDIIEKYKKEEIVEEGWLEPHPPRREVLLT